MGATAARGHDRVFLAACALLFLASAAVTLAWCGSMSGGMRMPGGWTMSMAWMRMGGQSWAGSAASFIGMWTVMMVAMMLPSLVPMLSAYRRSLQSSPGAPAGRMTALAGAGYFFVWALIGAAVYALGVALSAAEMRSAALSRSVPVATALLLLLAGLVQVSPWKNRQLGHCRDGSACAASASPDLRGAWGHGLRLGARCSLSSASLMIILVAIGVMDLGAMALVTGAVTLERVAPWPVRAARAIGLIVIVGAVLALAGRIHPA